MESIEDCNFRSSSSYTTWQAIPRTNGTDEPGSAASTEPVEQSFVYAYLGFGDCQDTSEEQIGGTNSGLECIESCVDRDYYWANWSTGGSCYCEFMSYTDEC